MNKLVVAAAMVLMGTAGAMAADMAVKAPPPPPVAAFSWAGFYVGGNLGYSWGESRNDWNIVNPNTAIDPLSGVCRPAGFALCLNSADKARLEGVIGGLQAGYNWVSGKYLLGIEGDVQYSGQKADQVFNRTFESGATLNGNPFPGAISATYSESLQWRGTLRGRVGLVSDRWAFYATGGLAVGEVKIDGSITGISNANVAPPGCAPISGFAASVICPFGAFSNRETRVGWTLGGGIEGMISQRWSWKVEYLHVDLGKAETRFATMAGCWGNYAVVGNTQNASCSTYAAGRGSISSRITDEIVRVAINYHFEAAPVTAKY